jgi:hypothetical protein
MFNESAATGAAAPVPLLYGRCPLSYSIIIYKITKKIILIQ